MASKATSAELDTDDALAKMLVNLQDDATIIDVCTSNSVGIDDLMKLFTRCAAEPISPSIEIMSFHFCFLYSVKRGHASVQRFVALADQIGPSILRTEMMALRWWNVAPPLRPREISTDVERLLKKLNDSEAEIIRIGQGDPSWNAQGLQAFEAAICHRFHPAAGAIFDGLLTACKTNSDAEPLEALRAKVVAAKRAILREAAISMSYSSSELFVESCLRMLKRVITHDDITALRKLEADDSEINGGVTQLQNWIAGFAAEREIRFQEKVAATLAPIMTIDESGRSRLTTDNYFWLLDNGHEDVIDEANALSDELYDQVNEVGTKYLKVTADFFENDLNSTGELRFIAPRKYHDAVKRKASEYVQQLLSTLAVEAIPDSHAAQNIPNKGESAPNVFKLRGDKWSIRFKGGETVHMDDDDGFFYIQIVLKHSGVDGVSSDDLYDLCNMRKKISARNVGGQLITAEEAAYLKRMESLSKASEKALDKEYIDGLKANIKELESCPNRNAYEDRELNGLKETYSNHTHKGKVKSIQDGSSRNHVGNALKRAIDKLKNGQFTKELGIYLDDRIKPKFSYEIKCRREPDVVWDFGDKLHKKSA